HRRMSKPLVNDAGMTALMRYATHDNDVAHWQDNGVRPMSDENMSSFLARIRDNFACVIRASSLWKRAPIHTALSSIDAPPNRRCSGDPGVPPGSGGHGWKTRRSCSTSAPCGATGAT